MKKRKRKIARQLWHIFHDWRLSVLPSLPFLSSSCLPFILCERQVSSCLSLRIRSFSQCFSQCFPFSVYDATAKVPSGLLSGNVNQFGDFDECVGVEGKDGIRGQYCLAYFKLDIDQSRPDLKYLHRLLHSHYAFRSNLTDVSTIVYLARRGASLSQPHRDISHSL